jgi:hypothetical protein
MTRHGRQTRLASALEGIVARLDRRSGGAYTQERISSVWGDLAGLSVSAHTTGAHLRQGTLIIYVDSPIWATELTAMSEQYRTAINKRLGEELVSSVRFSVSKKVTERRGLQDEAVRLDEFYDEDVVDSVPLTEAEMAQVKASVAVIRDQELREAVLRATVRDMEWKRGIAARNARETASGGS